jgi:hypothetical protein
MGSMFKYVRLGVCICLFAWLGCSQQPADYSGNTTLKPSDFLALFTEIKLPIVIADTNLIQLSDTTEIGYKAFTQFFPDSSLKSLVGKQKKGTQFRALGKITKTNEVYLLFISLTPSKEAHLFVIVTSPKNEYLDSKAFLYNQQADGYRHYVHINREPTFLVVREKTGKDLESIYTKTGWIYPTEGKFMVIINDSNEDTKMNVVINPIDSFPALHPLSWDYGSDKKNFIAVRDGSSAGKLLFFLHVEKNDGTCIGEIKGTLQLTGTRKGVFKQSGNPCVVNFNFTDNGIECKETGSCGNYRGIKCLLDEQFPKRKKPSRKIPKLKTPSTSVR